MKNKETEMGNKERLFEQFPPVSTAEWMEKINADLKGADFKKLVWRTNEGFDLMPFYRNEDVENLPFMSSLPGEYPYVRGYKQVSNDWLVRQDIDVTDFAAANAVAADILMKGVDSAGFILNDPENVNIENLRLLLKNIHPEAIEINFRPNGKAKELLEYFMVILVEKGTDPHQVHGAIEADPLGRLMLNGTLCIPPEAGLEYLAGLTKSALVLPNFRTIHIGASAIANSGGTLTQELAFALSMGNEYMSRLTERGLSASEAASKIRFSFASGPDFFPEIAKLRAARMLWSLIQKGYGNEEDASARMMIHSVTARWNTTAYDPHVNMLRTQTEAMAAVLGGADSITVEPFDTAFRKPDEFSLRIARNQQLILKEEAGFGKVVDPSAGSYYIEKLTEQFASAAWKLFTEVEQQGGFLEALKKGFIQEAVSQSSLKRKKDVSTRKTVLLGTNQYPSGREKLSSNADPSIMFPTETKGTDVRPLRPFRASGEFEKIRMSVEGSGKKPVVFLLTIGNPVMRRARAQFSQVFFECAGYRVIDNAGFGSIEEGTEAALASGADIVAICSSDEEYSQHAVEIFNILRDKFIVVIAGNPPCSEALKFAGIRNFIHVKSDVPGMLQYFNSEMKYRVPEKQ